MSKSFSPLTFKKCFIFYDLQIMFYFLFEIFKKIVLLCLLQIEQGKVQIKFSLRLLKLVTCDFYREFVYIGQTKLSPLLYITVDFTTPLNNEILTGSIKYIPINIWLSHPFIKEISHKEFFNSLFKLSW